MHADQEITQTSFFEKIHHILFFLYHTDMKLSNSLKFFLEQLEPQKNFQRLTKYWFYEKFVYIFTQEQKLQRVKTFSTKAFKIHNYKTN